MLYGAVVLVVICLTVLSLQQLLDAGQYRYRFSVLRKLGAEETEIRRLVVRQLGFWFGLPVGTAVLTGTAAVGCLLVMVQAEIEAYIGFGALAVQLCLLNGFSRRGRVFLRPLSKIHSHSMERFSHWETGLDKYAIS